MAVNTSFPQRAKSGSSKLDAVLSVEGESGEVLWIALVCLWLHSLLLSMPSASCVSVDRAPRGYHPHCSLPSICNNAGWRSGSRGYLRICPGPPACMTDRLPTSCDGLSSVDERSRGFGTPRALFERGEERMARRPGAYSSPVESSL